MNPDEMNEFYEIMKKIQTWEPARRLTLARRILGTLDEAIAGLPARPPVPRGRSAAEILADMKMDRPDEPGPRPRGGSIEESIGLGAGQPPADSSQIIKRGLLAEEVRELLKSKQPAPDDETVRQWIDEYRMEKYGR